MLTNIALQPELFRIMLLRCIDNPESRIGEVSTWSAEELMDELTNHASEVRRWCSLCYVIEKLAHSYVRTGL